MDLRNPMFYTEPVFATNVSLTQSAAVNMLNNSRARQWSMSGKNPSTRYIQPCTRNKINMSKDRVVMYRKDDTQIIDKKRQKYINKLRTYGAYGKDSGVRLAVTPRITNFVTNLVQCDQNGCF